MYIENIRKTIKTMADEIHPHSQHFDLIIKSSDETIQLEKNIRFQNS